MRGKLEIVTEWISRRFTRGYYLCPISKSDIVKIQSTLSVGYVVRGLLCVAVASNEESIKQARKKPGRRRHWCLFAKTARRRVVICGTSSCWWGPSWRECDWHDHDSSISSCTDDLFHTKKNHGITIVRYSDLEGLTLCTLIGYKSNGAAHFFFDISAGLLMEIQNGATPESGTLTVRPSVKKGNTCT